MIWNHKSLFTENATPLFREIKKEDTVECWKKKYDKIGAMMALSRCVSNRKGRRREKRYYKCQHCGSYHLTSEARQ